MNIYDKLKKVVKGFISILREDVIRVHLTIDGVEQKRFLTYIGEEPSIECDTETEYKCVLKCHDHLLEEDIIFRMKDVRMYSRCDDPEKEIESIRNKNKSSDMPPEFSGYVYERDKNARMICKLLDITEEQMHTSDIEAVNKIRKIWEQGLQQRLGEVRQIVDDALEDAIAGEDKDTLEEINIISAELEEKSGEFIKCVSEMYTLAEVRDYWPGILLPPPENLRYLIQLGRNLES